MAKAITTEIIYFMFEGAEAFYTESELHDGALPFTAYEVRCQPLTHVGTYHGTSLH